MAEHDHRQQILKLLQHKHFHFNVVAFIKNQNIVTK